MQDHRVIRKNSVKMCCLVSLIVHSQTCRKTCTIHRFKIGARTGCANVCNIALWFMYVWYCFIACLFICVEVRYVDVAVRPEFELVFEHCSSVCCEVDWRKFSAVFTSKQMSWFHADLLSLSEVLSPNPLPTR